MSLLTKGQSTQKVLMHSFLTRTWTQIPYRFHSYMQQFMHVQHGKNRVHNCNLIFKGLHVPKGSGPTRQRRTRKMFLSWILTSRQDKVFQRAGYINAWISQCVQTILDLKKKMFLYTWNLSLPIYIYISLPKHFGILDSLEWVFPGKVDDRAFFYWLPRIDNFLNFRINLDFKKTPVPKFWGSKNKSQD